MGMDLHRHGNRGYTTVESYGDSSTIRSVTTHYNRHGEAVKTSYELGELPSAGEAIGSFFGVFLIAFFIFGLLGLRDSAYSMMATPYVIFRATTGGGTGLIFLLAVVGLTVGFSLLAGFWDMSETVTLVAWPMILSVLCIVFHIFVLKTPAFVYDFASENLIEYIGFLICTVIQFFFFCNFLQLIIAPITRRKLDTIIVWIGMPIAFLLTNLLSFVLMLFLGDYPETASRFFSQTRPLCSMFDLTYEEMLPFLDFGSSIAPTVTNIATILLVVGVVVGGVWVFRKIMD